MSNLIKVVHLCIWPLKYETDLNVYETVNTLEILWLKILLSHIPLGLDRKKKYNNKYTPHGYLWLIDFNTYQLNCIDWSSTYCTLQQRIMISLTSGSALLFSSHFRSVMTDQWGIWEGLQDISISVDISIVITR